MSRQFKVSQAQLFLQDEAIMLDELTELEDASVFKLEIQPSNSYEKDYVA